MTIYCWFVRGQKHARLVQTSMAAAHAADETAVCVVATDDSAVTVPGAEMVRFSSGMPLMMANVQAQIEVLHRKRTPVWFLDTDIVLLRKLPELWEPSISVTWRDNVGGTLREPENDAVASMMPYNYGVIGATSNPVVIDAFTWLRERVRRMGPQWRDWYGNQMALASLVGPPPADKSPDATSRRPIPWDIGAPGEPTLLVRKLPCDLYNYTPASLEEDVSMRYALHFKGHSRPLLEQYAVKTGLPWLTKELAA